MMKFVLAMVLITGVLSSPTTLSSDVHIKVEDIAENLACLAKYIQTVHSFKKSARIVRDAAMRRDRETGVTVFKNTMAKIQKDKEDGEYDCMEKYEPYYYNTILGNMSSVPKVDFCSSKYNKTTEFISFLVEKGECLRSSGEGYEPPERCRNATINELDCLFRGYQDIITDGPKWIERKFEKESLNRDVLSFDKCTGDEEKFHCMITECKKYLEEYSGDTEKLTDLFQISPIPKAFNEEMNARLVSGQLKKKLKVIEELLDAAWKYVTAVAPQAKMFYMTGLKLINSWIPRTTTAGPMTTRSSSDLLGKMAGPAKRNLKTIN